MSDQPSVPVDEEKVWELSCATLVANHMEEFEQIQARFRKVIREQGDAALRRMFAEGSIVQIRRES